MSELMTDEQLTELEHLCKMKTEGPWLHGVSMDGLDQVKIFGWGTVTGLIDEDDARFIVGASEAMPRLLAEVRRLRTENAALAFDLEAARNTIETQRVIIERVEAENEAHRKAQEQAKEIPL